jgi:hypothetical protein
MTYPVIMRHVLAIPLMLREFPLGLSGLEIIDMPVPTVERYIPLKKFGNNRKE